MGPERGQPRRKRPTGGKPVGPRLILFGVLCAALLGAMIFVTHWVVGLGNAPTERQTTPSQPEETAAVGSSAAETEPEAEPAKKNGDQGKEPGEEPSPPAEAETDESDSDQAEPESEEPAEVAADEETPPVLVEPDIDLEKIDTLLKDVQDGTYTFDEPALYSLVKVCYALSRKAFQPDGPDEEVSFGQLLAMPGGFRGKAVTVSGRVGGVARWEAPHPEVTGVDHFWKIEMFRPARGNVAEVATLLVVENPGSLGQGDDIRAKAYFYKIRKYEKEHYDPDSGEGQVYIYNCPLLIGRHAKVVDAGGETEVADPKVALFEVAIAAAMVVLVAIVFFFVRRLIARRARFARTRETEELSEEEQARRIRYLEQQEQGGASAAPEDVSEPRSGSPEP